MSTVRLFSDGGGEKASNAAAACILEYEQQTLQVVAFLGSATNNEAEIFGGLLGFGVLGALSLSDGASVEWFCDSQYVLKSATEYIHNWQRNGWKTAQKKPVKNQALWNSYLLLKGRAKVQPNHVYGHTGHPENEACDSACTWARSEAESYIDAHGAISNVEQLSGYANGQWVLLDMRSQLQDLRALEGQPLTDADIDGLRRCMDSVVPLARSGEAPSAEEIAQRRFIEVRSEVQKLIERCELLQADSVGAKKLATELRRALEKTTS